MEKISVRVCAGAENTEIAGTNGATRLEREYGECHYGNLKECPMRAVTAAVAFRDDAIQRPKLPLLAFAAFASNDLIYKEKGISLPKRMGYPRESGVGIIFASHA